MGSERATVARNSARESSVRHPPSSTVDSIGNDNMRMQVRIVRESPNDQTRPLGAAHPHLRDAIRPRGAS